MKMRTVLPTLLILLVTGPLSAEPDLELVTPDWLPPEVRAAMVMQLAKGLEEIDYGKQAKPEELLAAAQLGVDDIIRRLEKNGVESLIENAPSFTSISLPPTDNRFASAIGAYGICSVSLHPELAKDAEERVFATFGFVSVVIVSAFLRDGFLATGGTDEPLKAYLAGEAMSKVGYAVQTNEELRDQITLRCGPILAGLLG